MVVGQTSTLRTTWLVGMDWGVINELNMPSDILKRLKRTSCSYSACRHVLKMRAARCGMPRDQQLNDNAFYARDMLVVGAGFEIEEGVAEFAVAAAASESDSNEVFERNRIMFLLSQQARIASWLRLAEGVDYNQCRQQAVEAGGADELSAQLGQGRGDVRVNG